MEFTRIERDAIIWDLRVNEWMLLGSIAQVFGLSMESVRKVLKKYQAPLRFKPPGLRTRLTHRQVVKIVQAHARLLPDVNVAALVRKTGFTIAEVEGIVGYYKLPLQKHRHLESSVFVLDVAEIEHLYLVKRMSVAQIAQKKGVSPTVMHRCMVHNDIPTRPVGFRSG